MFQAQHENQNNKPNFELHQIQLSIINYFKFHPNGYFKEQQIRFVFHDQRNFTVDGREWLGLC